ncbi:hypothetical protein K461DRAFT_303863 [Myriangium duriaei CBS 260.36]|uniref:Uncharacterized protein n=1 Tax=Myriangium duriaei CBS 260.36 TaxID=1168546 RepID=A0A9P4J8S6_9PEZI|nr:hypothetical protein K461DRAFT_303863 [Myriangium duriaei CBS 260.36]
MNGRRSQRNLTPPPRRPTPPGPTRLVTPCQRRAWADDERTQLLAYHDQGNLSHNEISNLMNQDFADRGLRTKESIIAQMHALVRARNAMSVSSAASTLAATGSVPGTGVNSTDALTPDIRLAANILMQIRNDTAVNSGRLDDNSVVAPVNSTLGEAERIAIEGLVELSHHEVRFPLQSGEPLLVHSRRYVSPNSTGTASGLGAPWSSYEELDALIFLMAQVPYNKPRIILEMRRWEASRGFEVRPTAEIEDKISEIVQSRRRAA